MTSPPNAPQKGPKRHLLGRKSIYNLYDTHAGTRTRPYPPIPTTYQPTGQRVTTRAGTGMGRALGTRGSTRAIA
jgi:hypothetical protein